MIEQKDRDALEERPGASGNVWLEEWGGIGFLLLMLLIIVTGIAVLVRSLV